MKRELAKASYAIETKYAGYRFRSRLEARWAVYFDAIGLEWEYEPEGFDLDGVRYLPDFWLSTVRMWAEVKPEVFTSDEYEKIRRLKRATGYPVLMLVGVPACRNYWVLTHEDDRGPGWPCRVDCVLTSSYFHENRFFWSPGFDGIMDEEDRSFWPDIIRAVEAARSARFEFGESPVPF